MSGMDDLDQPDLSDAEAEPQFNYPRAVQTSRGERTDRTKQSPWIPAKSYRELMQLLLKEYDWRILTPEEAVEQDLRGRWIMSLSSDECPRHVIFGDSVEDARLLFLTDGPFADQEFVISVPDHFDWEDSIWVHDKAPHEEEGWESYLPDISEEAAALQQRHPTCSKCGKPMEVDEYFDSCGVPGLVWPLEKEDDPSPWPDVESEAGLVLETEDFALTCSSKKNGLPEWDLRWSDPRITLTDEEEAKKREVEAADDRWWRVHKDEECWESSVVVSVEVCYLVNHLIDLVQEGRMGSWLRELESA